MTAALLKDCEMRMKKSIESMKAEFGKMRTGRAQASLLEHIMVSYYGNDTPLTQVGTVVASDARTLSVTPWDKTMLAPIEKAIRTANLGLNPVTSGDSVRVPVPMLTEERRRELIRVVKSEAENARVAIRNIRRDANTQLKNSLKDKKINEDEERRTQEHIQKLTDKIIAEADALLAAKEKDLMEI